MDKENIVTFTPCEEVKNTKVSTYLCPQGQLLNVCAYLYNVCPCTQMIVGVRVYLHGSFYSMQTKEIFTGYSSSCRQVIEELCVGEFSFLFLESPCLTQDIEVKVIAHYIY